MSQEKYLTGDETTFAQYVRHSDILRNWFVAYGIGGVLIFYTKDSVFGKFENFDIFLISSSFLLGVFIQVILSLYNKIYNFYLYIDTIQNIENTGSKEHAKKVGSDFRIDIICDVLTLIFFTIATCLLLYNLTKLIP